MAFKRTSGWQKVKPTNRAFRTETTGARRDNSSHSVAFFELGSAVAMDFSAVRKECYAKRSRVQAWEPYLSLLCRATLPGRFSYVLRGSAQVECLKDGDCAHAYGREIHVAQAAGAKRMLEGHCSREGPTSSKVETGHRRKDKKNDNKATATQ